MHNRERRPSEFGDFQAPIHLAREVCALIARTGFRPAAILEPTCGTGAFLQASAETFPDASRVLGFEINPQYVEQARQALRLTFPRAPVEIHQSDFFLTNRAEIVEASPEPLLVIGNPPWVTNAALSSRGGRNVPVKANLDNLPGMDALTGKSNFDISEWMLRRRIERLNGGNGALATLCKTSVARKVLLYARQKGMRIETASMHLIDAQTYVRASVDACLLLVRGNPASAGKECRVFRSLHARRPDSVFGLQDGMLVADVTSYLKWKDLRGTGLRGWRSGIKHDCSNVFELRVERGNLVNGPGEVVDGEPEAPFPLLKSSDLAAHREPHRRMLVPQRAMNDDPSRLRLDAPKAWNCLVSHAHLLDKRKSAIYRNRPRFSIFGIGPYAFARWKVAISGLHKKLEFVKAPPFQGKPTVLDDTCYFFSVSV